MNTVVVMSELGLYGFNSCLGKIKMGKQGQYQEKGSTCKGMMT